MPYASFPDIAGSALGRRYRLCVFHAALPLVLYFGADTDEQQTLNSYCVTSAAAKLSVGSPDFTANEIRVVCASISLAKEYLAGHVSLDVDAEHKAELRKHLFTYSRLEKSFAPVLDALSKKASS